MEIYDITAAGTPHRICIARDKIGAGGIKTVEKLSYHPMTDENLAMIKQMKVKRKYWNPFDSLTLIVVIE